MTPELTKVHTAARIRQEFIDHFAKRHGHTFAPSSPVIPHQDPTLMFINAGMNQFKDVFLGQGQRPYRRAVNSQKCIRAGGKHNDLEDVGRDGFHHTFFEMLGNWSFGDYFKPEAIEWAWQLLTETWGMDPDRLYVSVFGGDPAEGLEPDEEAEALWKGLVDPARISRWGKKDNFWEMGETGPCGPCSEIHYDGRSDADRAAVPGHTLVNKDHPDVIEIWNLVFIQYNRGPGESGQPGPLTPLPAKHVDTGMGLERVARFLQGKSSNYDTDLWSPIFRAIETHTGERRYGGDWQDPHDIAFRVIADHARCLTVALSDGARPSNEKSGYVLRRILRRAVRHAHQTLQIEGPLLYMLVPAVVETLGDAFPTLRENPQHVAEVIRDEEESFLRTLDRGLALFEEAAHRSEQVISATDAFMLHDTYGFPIDLTRVMAEERNMTVDEAGYEALREEARQRSRHGGETTASDEEALGQLPPDALGALARLDIAPTQDEQKYRDHVTTARIEAIWNGRNFDDSAHIGRPVALILNRTTFYPEAGGQVGDRGEIFRGAADFDSPPGRGLAGRPDKPDFRFKVEGTRAVGGYVLHVGRTIDGQPTVGDGVVAKVDAHSREPIMANHTATHLLNHALRAVVGDDVDQKGSLVAHDHLRFDYSCAHPLDEDQIKAVQDRVNRAIEAALQVDARAVPLEQAKQITGVRAVFGEQYPDPVRVVTIGATVNDMLADPTNAKWRDHSVEFCGGTHLATTDSAQHFVIVREQALAAGVRRVIAVSGAAALAATAAGEQLLAQVREAADLQGTELTEAFSELSKLIDQLTLPATAKHGIEGELDRLRHEVKQIRKQAVAGAREEVVAQAHAIAEAERTDPFVAAVIEGADKELLLAAMDVLRSKRPDHATILFSPDREQSKIAIAAAVPKPLIAKGLKAGDWVKQAASACGGGGGGRPDMAQAGGRDIDALDDAVAIAERFAKEKLG